MGYELDIDQEMEEWVAALNSGDYIQGYGVLSTGDGEDCCLGVKCKGLVAKGLAVVARVAGKLVYNGKESLLAGGSALLPMEIAMALDIASNGAFQIELAAPFNEVNSSLVELNDSQQFSFRQIADVIKYVHKYGYWSEEEE